MAQSLPDVLGLVRGGYALHDASKKLAEVIQAVEPRLWSMSTVLPILQDTTIVAAGPSVENVSLTGAVPVGIVGDAGSWTKGR